MPQHIVYQIIALRLFPHANTDPVEIFTAKLADNVFKAIVPACASLFPDPNLPWGQGDIIGNHNQLPPYIHLIIVRQRPDALPACIHISDGLCQDYFLPLYYPLADHCPVPNLHHRNIVLVRQCVNEPKTNVMPGIMIFLPRVPKSRYYKHAYPPFQFHAFRAGTVFQFRLLRLPANNTIYFTTKKEAVALTILQSFVQQLPGSYSSSGSNSAF